MTLDCIVVLVITFQAVYEQAGYEQEQYYNVIPQNYC